MSGIRQTKEVTCPCCGKEGVVQFGMAMIQGHDDHRQFKCCCGHALSIDAPRAILRLIWSDTKEMAQPILPS